MKQTTTKDYLEKNELDSNVVTVVTWPSTRKYMDTKWFKSESKIIKDDEGLKLFGLGAYIIPWNRI